MFWSIVVYVFDTPALVVTEKPAARRSASASGGVPAVPEPFTSSAMPSIFAKRPAAAARSSLISTPLTTSFRVPCSR
jgi:hypothetical protein